MVAQTATLRGCELNATYITDAMMRLRAGAGGARAGLAVVVVLLAATSFAVAQDCYELEDEASCTDMMCDWQTGSCTSPSYGSGGSWCESNFDCNTPEICDTSVSSCYDPNAAGGGGGGGGGGETGSGGELDIGGSGGGSGDVGGGGGGGGGGGTSAGGVTGNGSGGSSRSRAIFRCFRMTSSKAVSSR